MVFEWKFPWIVHVLFVGKWCNECSDVEFGRTNHSSWQWHANHSIWRRSDSRTLLFNRSRRYRKWMARGKTFDWFLSDQIITVNWNVFGFDLTLNLIRRFYEKFRLVNELIRMHFVFFFNVLRANISTKNKILNSRSMKIVQFDQSKSRQKTNSTPQRHDTKKKSIQLITTIQKSPTNQKSRSITTYMEHSEWNVFHSVPQRYCNACVTIWHFDCVSYVGTACKCPHTNPVSAILLDVRTSLRLS